LLVFTFRAEVVSIKAPLDALEPGKRHGNDDKVGDYEDIYEQQNEKLAVPEANAVVNPGAVMVHIKHASVAR